MVLVVFSAGRAALPLNLALLGACSRRWPVVIGLGEDPHPANFVYLGTVVLAAWAAGYALRITEERSELARRARAHAGADQDRRRAARRRLPQRLRDRRAGRRRAARPARGQPDRADARRHRAARTADPHRAAPAPRVSCTSTHGAAPLAPQPGIADIADWCTSAQRPGLGVRPSVRGRSRPIGDGSRWRSTASSRRPSPTSASTPRADGATVTLRWAAARGAGRGPRPRATPGGGCCPARGSGCAPWASGSRPTAGTVEHRRGGRGFRVVATLPVEAPDESSSRVAWWWPTTRTWSAPAYAASWTASRVSRWSARRRTARRRSARSGAPARRVPDGHPDAGARRPGGDPAGAGRGPPRCGWSS